MKLVSASKYYFKSSITLLGGVNLLSLIDFLLKGGTIRLKNGFTFSACHFLDLWAIKEVVLDDCYKLKKGKRNVVLDIGAGIGDFSILVSKFAGKVYAFEVAPERAKLMKKI